MYLAPLLPAASGNGGRRAVFNHLLDVMATTTDIDLLVVNVEASSAQLPKELATVRSRVLSRALPRGTGIRGRLSAIHQWIFDHRPRSAAVIASVVGRQAVRELLALGQTELVVVDHLNAWGLLEGIETDVPIQYIAHNVETDVLSDQLSYANGSWLAWLRLKIERAKVRRFELALLSRADYVTVISASDCLSPLMRPFLNRIQAWPELPEPRMVDWQSSQPSRLLFVGSAAYFPNRDAIEWLVVDFMSVLSRLAPNVVLHIAGTSAAALKDLPMASNVVFEGFVPDRRLCELHRTSSLFVCPVVLGSGIKIKVLEASAYGLPVAATAESLKGIDYLDGVALKISRDPEAAALAVLDLLYDPPRLAACRIQAFESLTRSRMSRQPLLAQHILPSTRGPSGAQRPSVTAPICQSGTL